MPAQKIIVGVDEVGRGAWAGPLVVGAVQLSCAVKGLKDSKLLTPKKRAEIAREIYINCDEWSLGWVEPEEIDERGLTLAIKLAMQRAVKKFSSDVEIIIDGSFNFLSEHPGAKTLVKADQTIPSVSAASVIAKVARDEYMQKLSRKFSAYGFETNVGYGTQFHRQALKKYGPCLMHRKSYKPVMELLV